MRPIWTALISGAAAVLVLACGGPAPDSGATSSTGGSTSPAERLVDMSLPETPPPEAKGLTKNQRRVVVFVMPGNAAVEVDGKPTPRRDGAIDIVGDIGREYKVKATIGPNSHTEQVTIQDRPGPPVLVDANAPAPGAQRPKFFGSVND